MTRARQMLFAMVLCAASATAWWVAIDLRLTHEATASLESSDRAFNEGKLRASLQAAHRASMAWLPGARLALIARARLRAIAVGSEATGRPRSALLAWSALAASASSSPGVSSSVIAIEAAQHVDSLLPKRSGLRDAEAAAKDRTSAIVASPFSSVTGAACLLAASVLLCWLVLGAARSRGLLARDAFWRGWALSSVGLVAGFCWCIGWVLV